MNAYDEVSPEEIDEQLPRETPSDEEGDEMEREFEGDEDDEDAEAFDEPADLDSDDYWTDHDIYGGGSFDGDSDLGGEY